MVVEVATLVLMTILVLSIDVVFSMTDVVGTVVYAYDVIVVNTCDGVVG